MEIQRIVPAPDGSRAVFADYSRKKPRINYLPSPLFALVVDEDGSQFVSPMVCDGRNGMEVAAIMEGYLGWASPQEGEEEMPYWLERANEVIEEEEEDHSDDEEEEEDESDDEEEDEDDEEEDDEEEDDEEEDEDDEEEDEFDEDEDEPSFEDESTSTEEDEDVDGDKPVGQVRGRRAR